MPTPNISIDNTLWVRYTEYMIKFRHYPPNRLTVTKYYGVFFESHPKRKALDIYWGKHVFVFFTGRSY